MAKRSAFPCYRPLARLLLGVAALASVGCGAEFDPPTEMGVFLTEEMSNQFHFG